MCASLCVFGCVYVYFAHKLKPFLTHRRCCRRMTPLYVCMHMFMYVCMLIFSCKRSHTNAYTTVYVYVSVLIHSCKQSHTNEYTLQVFIIDDATLCVHMFVCLSVCECVYSFYK